MIHKFRIYSGLVMLTFVVGHFINHSLGLISLDAMEAGRPFLMDPWRTLAGSVLIIGAALIHAGVGLWTLYRRRNLKMKGWEMAQLILGLSIPLMLTGHVIATRGVHHFLDVEGSFTNEQLILWIFHPESIVRW